MREALVATFRRLIRLYFRRIERVGDPPRVGTRGRVFVSNHHNALIDPILVLTDAACEISPIAKSTLWNIPGIAWLLDRAGAVPIVRRKDHADKDASSNEAMFAKIASHLADGGNILIFPEGTSHSEPTLAPLKTGAARMLIAAEHAARTPPTFQAVALEFDEKDQFRSRCLVLWGPVRQLSEVPGDGEDRVKAITAQMEADLGELLVEADTHEDRRLIARIAEMLAHDAGDGSLSVWNDLGRKIELAGKALREADPALVAQIRDHVDAYYAELHRLGRRDAEPARVRIVSRRGLNRIVHGEQALGPRLRRLALAPLAISGFALYAIPYFIPRMVARRADEDAVSTVKLATALVVYPLWMGGLVGASLVMLPPPLSLGAAAIAIASPFAALRWLDEYWERDRDITDDERAQLARLRIAARTAIDEARARL